MKKTITLLDHFFNFLLRTYPKSYQVEYGLEVRNVFKQIIHDAAKQNAFQLTIVTLRELRDYPITWIREHWLNYRKKELVMVTNTSAQLSNGCPRCGSVKAGEARYCLNCGLAFIPFKEYITEQSQNFFNNELVLRVFGVLTFFSLSLIAADRILFHGFHPTTNIIVISGTALFSFFTGWQLFGKRPNAKKLRFLLIIAVITLAFFKLTSTLDELYLSNTLTAATPLSYQFLDSKTYVDYIEDERNLYTNQRIPYIDWMRIHYYYSPYTIFGINNFLIKSSSRPYDITYTNPAIGIERSWAFKDYYGPSAMLFIAISTALIVVALESFIKVLPSYSPTISIL